MMMLAETMSSAISLDFWLIVGTVAVVAIVSTALTTILGTRAREKTRREIAAYLAEGSIDRETAVAVLKAGRGEEEDEESEEE